MREKWIDNAKGIAMLLVIIGHVSAGLQGLLSFDFVYGVHMVIFFLVSGYNLKKSDITQNYLNKQFRRLMVPYFVTCFAVLFADIVNSGVQNHDLSIDTITSLISRDLLRMFFASGSITNFGSIEIGTRIGAIWFFPALFFAFVFFQIVIKCCKENTEAAGIILAVIAIFGYISARFVWLPFSVQSGMFSAFFLYLGYALRESNTLEKIRWYYYIIALLIFCFGIFRGYCYIGFVRADSIDLLVSTATGLAGSLLVYGVSRIYKGGLFQYVGKRTVTILCVHLFALETMGFYFSRINDCIGTSGNARIWTNIGLHILFAMVVAIIIERIKPFFYRLNKLLLERLRKNEDISRDISVDISKGIFILLMVIGHIEIDNTFRTIIFSCHMVAFIFLSGYCFNNTRSITQSLKRMGKTFLLPYGVVMVSDVLLHINQWSFGYFKNTIVQYLMGVSFTKELCVWCPSVGPIYFILLLFTVRTIYMLLYKYIMKDTVRLFIVLGISLFGVYLGKAGLWLPWSFDVACYCLLFFMIGHLFRKKQWLQWTKNNHVFYFIASPIWVYMIYMGGMEIAVRKYGKYGLVFIGSVSGVLLIIKLADYIANHLPICRIVFQKAGQATIIVLIIHTLLRPFIERSVQQYVGGVPFLALSTIIQVVIAVIIKRIIVGLGRHRNIS